MTVEHGDPNVGDAKRIFEDIRATVRAAGHPEILGTFRDAKKRECPELMLADFFAYTEYMRHTQDKNENLLTDKEVSEIESQATKEQMAQLSYLSLDKDQLRGLSKHFAELRRLKKAREG